MTSHARRSTIESARICEQLLKRVVEEVNRGNGDVRVTTKMYTVGECLDFEFVLFCWVGLIVSFVTGWNLLVNAKREREGERKSACLVL